MIDLLLDDVKRVVDEHGYKKVIALLPAGVMNKAGELLKIVPEVVFMSNPCYGACDVPMHLLDQLKADALFNFGHSKPIKWPLYPENVHFFEIQIRREPPQFVPDFQRVGLVYVIQYRDSFMDYAKFLEGQGKTVVLGKKPGFMATHDGQVTGCDVGAARLIESEVDGFVVACDGLFHANAVAGVGKTTFNWHGEQAVAPKFPMAALFTAKKVGIVTSTKPGQFYAREAETAKQKLEAMGKQVFFIAGDVLTPEINNFQVDFWVTAACPRMAEDEWLSPSAPVQEVLKYLE